MVSSRKGKPIKKAAPAKRPSHPQEHPIAISIDRLIHRARDIKVAGRKFLPVALRGLAEQYEEMIKVFKDQNLLLDDSDAHTRVHAQRQIHETLVRFNRLRQSEVPRALETGLFLALFSAFDAFTGDLLRGLYERKPLLFNSLNKTLTFAEVLAAPTIDVLRLQVLSDDIESLRRKSYPDQFDAIGARFKVELTKFERWSDFVECSQRRNLLTHCDGVVSDQYISVCRAVGCKTEELPKVGERIQIGAKYFYTSCELIIEVGLKLGQTLWRKTLPEELGESDEHLMRALYDALENGQWARAKDIGEFAYGMRDLSSDRNRKIITINYSQALKRTGEVDQARVILGSIDWSAAANDYKLARAVLLEEYDEAYALMKKIGIKGELLDEAGYHTWPLFIEIRLTDGFSAIYQEIFGHPFAQRLRADAEEASREASEEAKKGLPLPQTEDDPNGASGNTGRECKAISNLRTKKARSVKQTEPKARRRQSRGPRKERA